MRGWTNSKSETNSILWQLIVAIGGNTVFIWFGNRCAEVCLCCSESGCAFGANTSLSLVPYFCVYNLSPKPTEKHWQVQRR